MSRAYAWALGCVFGVAMSASTVHAGPIELFNAASIDPVDAMQLIAPYQYGGGGMFVSHDGGKSFGMVCTSSIDPNVVHDNFTAHLTGQGEIYIGVFDGLYKGDANGCGFAAVPELAHHYIEDVAADPLDPKRTYVVTSDAAPKQNGVYMNDGSGTFMPFGAQIELFLNSVNVVKNGTGRRFYVTGVKTDAMTNTVTYSVRVSDDDAKTWTESVFPLDMFGPKDPYAEFLIIAVDPTNPDHVLGRIRRDRMVDTLVYSPMQGKEGTWKMLAEVNALDAITFTPDGKLYYGDNDQTSPGLFVVDNLDSAPKQLSKDYKVGCLQWDETNKRMLACNDFKFGTADTTSGAFKAVLDMRCAQTMVTCPDAMPMHDVCQAQLLNAYCGLSHYPLAPLCAGYDQGEGTQEFKDAAGYTCQDGFPKSSDPTGAIATPLPDGGLPMTSTTTGATSAEGSAGTVAAAGSGAAGADHSGHGTAGTAAVAAGSGATVGAAGTPAEAPAPAKKSGGCSVTDAGGLDALASLWPLAVLGVAIRARARRRS